MPREPTPDDLKRLRRLREKAGSESNFAAWIEAAKRLPKRKPRKQKEIDALLLPGLATYCAVAERELGLTPTEAIRLFIHDPKADKLSFIKLLGASEKATVARLYGKLKKRKFPDRVVTAYWKKHGVDPSRFNFKTLPWPERSAAYDKVRAKLIYLLRARYK